MEAPAACVFHRLRLPGTFYRRDVVFPAEETPTDEASQATFAKSWIPDERAEGNNNSGHPSPAPNCPFSSIHVALSKPTTTIVGP
ncbi:hypothetical protein AAWM_10483 [Aspergillus awamori]|uniref:Uncharacterized protein n=1 Tax=Aspergillus awamori TaxID=105351 RepID=A0A401L7Y6_ASPAW|nr:hypothetical protein AAWM_10483 [Aspergillus awamori]